MPVSPRHQQPLNGTPVHATEPNHLRPYTFHGVYLSVHGTHALGNCPFCGREGKFSIEVATGLWRCLVCATGTANGGGNALVFVRLLYERAVETAKMADPFAVSRIAQDRRLLAFLP